MTVVFWVAEGFALTAAGTAALTKKVPFVLVLTSAWRLILEPGPPGMGGTVQVTMTGPVPGCGAQPVMGLPASVPVKVKVPGILRLSVVCGEELVARSSFSMVTV